MEKVLFREVFDAGSFDDDVSMTPFGGPHRSLVMRLMDDYLLVTTDQKIALRFLDRMLRGLPEKGVQVDPLKTVLSFESPEHVERFGVKVDTSGDGYGWEGGLVM